MVEEAHVVDLEASLADAAGYMADHRQGSVLVTRRGKLAGVFTSTDACRVLAELLEAEVGRDQGDEVA